MSEVEDPAITAIRALGANGDMPTYAWLKHKFGSSQISESVWRSLNRGRAILRTIDQLDQYLYS